MTNDPISCWRNCNKVWVDTDEYGYKIAVVGGISEEGERYPLIFIDCDQYESGDESAIIGEYLAKCMTEDVFAKIEYLQEQLEIATKALDVCRVQSEYAIEQFPFFGGRDPILSEIKNTATKALKGIK